VELTNISKTDGDGKALFELLFQLRANGVNALYALDLYYRLTVPVQDVMHRKRNDHIPLLIRRAEFADYYQRGVGYDLVLERIFA